MARVRRAISAYGSRINFQCIDRGLPGWESKVMMAIPHPLPEHSDMPVPHIYKEFFHQARQVETYIKIWTEDDHFKGRPLESLFYYSTPDIKAEQSISFGEFIAKTNDLAQRYGLSVRPPEDTIKDVAISGKAIYAMSMHILDRSRSQSKDLAQMEQLVPIVRDFATLVESLVSFDHPQPRSRINFDDLFTMNAKMGLRQVYDHLELFDERKSAMMAKKADKKISELFASLPGEFQDQMTTFAIILEGGRHGRQQANTLKELAEPTGPGL